VTSASAGIPDCIFCNTSEPSRGDLIIARGRVSFVVLNLYPYNNGHLMVVPDRHVASLASMTSEEQVDLMRLTRHAEIALNEAYTPQGLNIGINLGKPAGAGVADHLHVHLVPRWNGDTNFMPVLAEVKVVNEHLLQTAAKLKKAFAAT